MLSMPNLEIEMAIGRIGNITGSHGIIIAAQVFILFIFLERFPSSLAGNNTVLHVKRIDVSGETGLVLVKICFEREFAAYIPAHEDPARVHKKFFARCIHFISPELKVEKRVDGHVEFIGGITNNDKAFVKKLALEPIHFGATFNILFRVVPAIVIREMNNVRFEATAAVGFWMLDKGPCFSKISFYRINGQ